MGYSLENAVEGAEISVTPAGSYEWVLGTEVEPSAIRVSLAENETTDPREAEFSVTYPGMTEKVAFTITQDAGPAYFILQIRHNTADLYFGHGRCLA